MRHFPFSLRWMIAMVIVVAALVVGLWGKLRGINGRLQVADPEVVLPHDLTSGASVGEAFEAELVAETAGARVALEARVPVVPPQLARPGDGRSLRGRVEFVGLDPELQAKSGSSAEGAGIYLLFTAVGGERDGVFEDLDGLGWSCELPYLAEDIASIKVAGVVREERLWLAVAGFESVMLDFSAEAVVRVELAPVTSIRVVDAKTRAPIPRFRAAFRPARAASGAMVLSNDGARDLRTSELAHEVRGTRLELHPRENWGIWPGEPFTAHLSADGHGEASIEFVVGSGVEHEVRLPRAGDALFRWPSEDVARRVNSVLIAEGGSLVLTLDPLEQAIAEDGSRSKRTVQLDWTDFHPKLEVEGEVMMLAEARFEKLVEELVGGSYRASLEHRSEGVRGTTRLAEAEFSIKAGRRVEVLLQDVVDPEAVFLPLELEFAMPEGSGAPAGERVLLSRASEGDWGNPVPLLLASETWRTHAFVVRPGKFRVSVRGLRNFEREFEFSPQSASPVVVPVPTLHHFRIQLVSDSGAVVGKKERVGWSSSTSAGQQTAWRDASAPGRSEFFTDALPVKVSLWGATRTQLLGGPVIELALPGEYRLTCIERPRLRLRVRTEGEYAKVPVFLKVYFSHSPDGSRMATQERIRAVADQPDELRVWFPQAGEYELEFRDIEEFEPIPPLRVNIGARHDQLIELPLIPKR